MAEQHQSFTETGFNGKTDIKSSTIYLMNDIIKQSRLAMSSIDKTTSIIAWGCQIQCFDAMLFPLFMNDEKFMRRRYVLQKNGVASSTDRYGQQGKNHGDYFNYYLNWFRLLCEKLPELGIFGDNRKRFEQEVIEDE